VNVAVWISGGGVGLAAASLAFTVARARSGSAAALHRRITAVELDLRDRIESMGREMASRAVALETKVDVFWRTVTISAAQVLHSPHPEHARRDALLEALMAGRLDLAGAAELARLVDAVREDEAAADGERLAAGQVLGYLRAVFEAGG
jgi:hypothetical protein